MANGSDKHTCRTRYQQTPVEVYARFIAVDQVIQNEQSLFLLEALEKRKRNDIQIFECKFPSSIRDALVRT